MLHFIFQNFTCEALKIILLFLTFSVDMSAHAYFLSDLLEEKLLIVGAGGIGCELIKNLVLGGFKNIEIVCLHSNFVQTTNLIAMFAD